MTQSFDNLIWPTELQLSNNIALKYARISSLNKFFGRLITYARNTSIALAIIYYITFNYIIPNISLIKTQRSSVCIQNILKTRSLLKDLDARVSALNQVSVENNLSMSMEEHNLRRSTSALENKIKKYNTSLVDDINDLNDDLQTLTKKLNTSILS